MLSRGEGAVLHLDLVKPQRLAHRASLKRITRPRKPRKALCAATRAFDVSSFAAQSGEGSDPNCWRLLVDVVKTALWVWRPSDHGIWELRAEPLHFVHSKVMCWAVLDRGIRRSIGRSHNRHCRCGGTRAMISVAPSTPRDAIAARRFVQAFGSDQLDAALCCCRASSPSRTTMSARSAPPTPCAASARTRLAVRRYTAPDGLEARKGRSCPARSGLANVSPGKDVSRTRATCSRALPEISACSARSMICNAASCSVTFPQGLSHYLHISAALALGYAGPE